VGRTPLDPEIKKQNVKNTRRAYRERLRDEKKDNGTYRPPGRPKRIKQEEKVEEKVD
jgi:hypothetical protein